MQADSRRGVVRYGRVAFVLMLLPLLASCPGLLLPSRHTVVHEGIERDYLLYVPGSRGAHAALPLVVVLHGGQSPPGLAAVYTRFHELGEQEGFMTAYPEGHEHNWNDGALEASDEAHRLNLDDVGFIDKVIDDISARYPVDAKRVYVAGISSGAAMAHRYAAERAERVAAISAGMGGVPAYALKEWRPLEPVSVLSFNGTDDPIMPYEGGEARLSITRELYARVASVRETMRFWRQHNACDGTPSTFDLPDTNVDDGSRVTQSVWENGLAGTEVALFEVEGGGHTWPGGRLYLPEIFIGRPNWDVDATEESWAFFESHPKP